MAQRMICCSSPAFEMGIIVFIVIDRCRCISTDLLYLSLGSRFSRSLTFSSRTLLSRPADGAAGCIAAGGPCSSGAALCIYELANGIFWLDERTDSLLAEKLLHQNRHKPFASD